MKIQRSKIAGRLNPQSGCVSSWSRRFVMAAVIVSAGLGSSAFAAEKSKKSDKADKSKAEAAPPARAPEVLSERRPVDPEILAMWNDPTFQKQFVGTYGVNAEVEPRISVEDGLVLEKIRPLMGNDQAGARAALEKAMKNPKADPSATLYFTLGNMSFQDGNMPDALANYKIAVERFPTFRRAWRNIGLIYIKDGRFDEAINAFTKMITLGGGDATSYGLLGYAYASKQDYQAAEVALRNALLLEPQNTDWRLRLTDCVFRQGKYEDCASLLTGLIQKNPEKASFWMLQAQCYIGMKKPLLAAQNLESMSQLGHAKNDTYYLLGQIYVTEELPDLALFAFQRGVDADVNQSADAAVSWTEVLAARGAPAQARLLSAQISKTLEKNLTEKNKQKLLKLDARLSMADGKSSPESAAVREEILKLDPLDAEALMLLAQHHASNKNPEQAIFYFERAANLEKFEANAKLRHGQLLVNLKRYADALPLLRRVQEIAPREDVARYVEQVERAAQADRAVQAAKSKV